MQRRCPVPAWGDNAHPYAAEAAEFGAVWAEASISQLLHADEAAKHFGDALQRNRGEFYTNHSSRTRHAAELASQPYKEQTSKCQMHRLCCRT